MNRLPRCPTKQFILTSFEFDSPPGWLMRKIGVFFLYHCPKLPIIEITETDDSSGFFVLGWVFSSPESWANISEMFGRYICIRSDGILTMDPLGSYSIVYSKSLGIVASSTAVFPENLLNENHALNKILNLPYKDNWYPFGLTPYVNVNRLLPNQNLNILEMRTCRKCKFSPIIDKPFNVIAEALNKQLGIIAKNSSLTSGLTAGNETRMLLSGLKELSNKTNFVTYSKTKTSQDAITVSVWGKASSLA